MPYKVLKEKTIIGWREYVDFPEWGLQGIRAKVDTGARTSSLHVDDLKLLKNDLISFYVVVSEKRHRRKKVTAKRLRKGRVKSSTGERTHRWYVKTSIRIGQYEREIVLNLTDRGGMNFRMLLGRTAIEGALLVNVDRSFLLTKKQRRE